MRVVDGDTIRVLIDGEEKTIRLIGIDTPETKAPQKPVECFGQEATEKLVNLLDDEEVILESDNTQSDQDRYGRLLRYVFLQDGTNVNLEMIKQGYAYEYTYGAPYIYQNEFKQAQQEAQLNDRGLWSPQTCDGKRE